jgi:hypothetical protein
VSQEVKVKKQFGVDKFMKIASSDGYLKMYGEYLLPKKVQDNI